MNKPILNTKYQKISAKLVKLISSQKKENKWMLNQRLGAYEIFKSLKIPAFMEKKITIDYEKLCYFANPLKYQAKNWDDLPKDVKHIYEQLGIPEAEKKYLSGVATQHESQVVYQSLKKMLDKKGVIFTSMDEGLKKYPEMVKKYFGKLVPATNNKFAALNSALWSGGVFIYIPKNVKVELPLQAYFSMAQMNMAQFERTLIIADEGSSVSYVEGCSAPLYSSASLHAGVVEIFIKKNARVRYTTIQNWSKNVYNLTTKRMQIEENGFGEWIDGNLGSHMTFKYPSMYLIGCQAKGEILSLSCATSKQVQDTGGKAIHLASHTSSQISSKSISNGGITNFRGIIKIGKNLTNVKSHMSCDSLLLNDKSVSNSYPNLEVESKDVEVTHEATIGKINQEQLFYLQSRGLSYETAVSMIVNGFIDPIVKTIPLEYAVELNRLIDIDIKGL